MERAMKRVSLAGLVLGVVLGAAVGLLSGSRILWLGMGLAIGVFVGSALVQRPETKLYQGQQAKL
jgi:hypothetical protein